MSAVVHKLRFSADDALDEALGHVIAWDEDANSEGHALAHSFASFPFPVRVAPIMRILPGRFRPVPYASRNSLAPVAIFEHVNEWGLFDDLVSFDPLTDDMRSLLGRAVGLGLHDALFRALHVGTETGIEGERDFAGDLRTERVVKAEDDGDGGLVLRQVGRFKTRPVMKPVIYVAPTLRHWLLNPDYEVAPVDWPRLINIVRERGVTMAAFEGDEHLLAREVWRATPKILVHSRPQKGADK